MSKGEVFTGMEALRTRLKFYKNSKKPSVSNIKDFVNETLGDKVKHIQFAGHTYSTKRSEGFSGALKAAQILDGIPFEVTYSSVDPGFYGSIHVYYVYDKYLGILKPFKAEWEDASSENRKTKVAILDPHLHLRSEIRDVGKDLTKDKILAHLQDRKKAKAWDSETKRLINSARHAGYDHPGLKDLEAKLDPKSDPDFKY
jgi:hypothetical protein